MTSDTTKPSKWFAIGAREAADRKAQCDPPENMSQREYREYMRGWNSVRAAVRVSVKPIANPDFRPDQPETPDDRNLCRPQG